MDVQFFGLPEINSLIDGVYTLIILEDLTRIKSNAIKVLKIALRCDFEEQLMMTNLSDILTLTTDLWRNYLIGSHKQIVFVCT